jgi:hypothetical protein
VFEPVAGRSGGGCGDGGEVEAEEEDTPPSSGECARRFKVQRRDGGDSVGAKSGEGVHRGGDGRAVERVEQDRDREGSFGDGNVAAVHDRNGAGKGIELNMQRLVGPLAPVVRTPTVQIPPIK